MRYIISAAVLFILVGATNTFAQTYYVKNGGNDSNTGLSHSQAWATIGKVNSSVSGTGDDVYFLAGDTWTGKVLSIKWGGTSGNRAIVGSYYMNSGSETVGVPDGTTRPTLQGGYISNTSLGTVPAPNGSESSYGGMVDLGKAYTTLQNIRVINSSGYGIINNGANNLIDSNVVNKTAGAGIFIYNGDNTVVSNNYVEKCNWYRYDKLKPGYFNHPVCTGAKGVSGVSYTGNTIVDSYGEGIDAYHNADNMTISDNLIAGSYNPAIYVDNSLNVIVERNIILKNGIALTGKTRGITLALETWSTNTNASAIIRNNLIAGAEGCLTIDAWPDQTAKGNRISGQFIGNTCVGATKALYGFNNSGISTFEMRNNIFDTMTDGADSCGAGSNITMDYNHWNIVQTNTYCVGAGDKYGNPNLRSTANFKLFSFTNLPNVSDFEPITGSSVINAGILTTNLTQDYKGNARQSTPTFGALETGSNLSVLKTPTGLSLSIQ